MVPAGISFTHFNEYLTAAASDREHLASTHGIRTTSAATALGRLAVPHSGVAFAGEADVTAVASDILQVLGEIIIDRASQQGFDLLRQRVLAWLRCPPSTTTPDAVGRDGGDDTVPLPQTCGALAHLRIEDVAARPEVLLAALVADVIAHVSTALHASTDEQLARLVANDLLDPLVRQVRGDHSPVSIAELTQIVHDVAHLATGGESTPLQRVALCAASTLALCSGNSGCNVDDVLDQALPSCQGDEQDVDALRRHSRSVASGLMAMFPFTQDTAPFETRAGHAVDAVAELACVTWSTTTNDTTPSATTCDETDLLSADPTTTAADHRGPRMLMRSVRVIHAFLDHDPTAVALEATHAVVDALVFRQAETSAVADSGQLETRRDQARALRLVGGLLTFASTYETHNGQTTAEVIAQGHDERRQILESLSAEFTNRDQREGDVIFSFGGSLRLNGGVRFFNPDGPDAGTSFWGPASLVLGMGLDYVHDCGGLHLELGVFDLGQYLSFGDSVTLRTPNPAAAVSPSITVAVSFGRQVPFFLGATFGGSPFQPEANSTDDGRRVLYVGGVAGFYVPLFDVN